MIKLRVIVLAMYGWILGILEEYLPSVYVIGESIVIMLKNISVEAKYLYYSYIKWSNSLKRNVIRAILKLNRRQEAKLRRSYIKWWGEIRLVSGKEDKVLIWLDGVDMTLGESELRVHAVKKQLEQFRINILHKESNLREAGKRTIEGYLRVVENMKDGIKRWWANELYQEQVKESLESLQEEERVLENEIWGAIREEIRLCRLIVVSWTNGKYNGFRRFMDETRKELRVMFEGKERLISYYESYVDKKQRIKNAPKVFVKKVKKKIRRMTRRVLGIGIIELEFSSIRLLIKLIDRIKKMRKRITKIIKVVRTSNKGLENYIYWHMLRILSGIKELRLIVVNVFKFLREVYKTMIILGENLFINININILWKSIKVARASKKRLKIKDIKKPKSFRISIILHLIHTYWYGVLKLCLSVIKLIVVRWIVITKTIQKEKELWNMIKKELKYARKGMKDVVMKTQVLMKEVYKVVYGAVNKKNIRILVKLMEEDVVYVKEKGMIKSIIMLMAVLPLWCIRIIFSIVRGIRLINLIELCIGIIINSVRVMSVISVTVLRYIVSIVWHVMIKYMIMILLCEYYVVSKGIGSVMKWYPRIAIQIRMGVEIVKILLIDSVKEIAKMGLLVIELKRITDKINNYVRMSMLIFKMSKLYVGMIGFVLTKGRSIALSVKNVVEKIVEGLVFIILYLINRVLDIKEYWKLGYWMTRGNKLFKDEYDFADLFWRAWMQTEHRDVRGELTRLRYIREEIKGVLYEGVYRRVLKSMVLEILEKIMKVLLYVQLIVLYPIRIIYFYSGLYRKYGKKKRELKNNIVRLYINRKTLGEIALMYVNEKWYGIKNRVLGWNMKVSIIENKIVVKYEWLAEVKKLVISILIIILAVVCMYKVINGRFSELVGDENVKGMVESLGLDVDQYMIDIVNVTISWMGLVGLIIGIDLIIMGIVDENDVVGDVRGDLGDGEGLTRVDDVKMEDTLESDVSDAVRNELEYEYVMIEEDQVLPIDCLIEEAPAYDMYSYVNNVIEDVIDEGTEELYDIDEVDDIIDWYLQWGYGLVTNHKKEISRKSKGWFKRGKRGELEKSKMLGLLKEQKEVEKIYSRLSEEISKLKKENRDYVWNGLVERVSLGKEDEKAIGIELLKSVVKDIRERVIEAKRKGSNYGEIDKLKENVEEIYRPKVREYYEIYEEGQANNSEGIMGINSPEMTLMGDEVELLSGIVERTGKRGVREILNVYLGEWEMEHYKDEVELELYRNAWDKEEEKYYDVTMEELIELPITLWDEERLLVEEEDWDEMITRLQMYDENYELESEWTYMVEKEILKTRVEWLEVGVFWTALLVVIYVYDEVYRGEVSVINAVCRMSVGAIVIGTIVGIIWNVIAEKIECKVNKVEGEKEKRQERRGLHGFRYRRGYKLSGSPTWNVMLEEQRKEGNEYMRKVYGLESSAEVYKGEEEFYGSRDKEDVQIIKKQRKLEDYGYYEYDQIKMRWLNVLSNEMYVNEREYEIKKEEKMRLYKEVLMMGKKIGEVREKINDRKGEVVEGDISLMKKYMMAKAIEEYEEERGIFPTRWRLIKDRRYKVGVYKGEIKVVKSERLKRR